MIHRLVPLGADPADPKVLAGIAAVVMKRLDEEPDISIRRALLLALGEFGESAIPLDARNSLLLKLHEIYRTDPDPGLHAAAQWLLRQWNQTTWLNQVNDNWAKDDAERAKRLAEIQQSLSSDKDQPSGHSPLATGHSPRWYVNSQGQTLVVIPGPVTYQMGSPPQEVGRMNQESQHSVRIGRTFAILAAPVTLDQFHAFHRERFGRPFPVNPNFPQDSGQPVRNVTWYLAAEYCNWLSEKEQIPQDQWCYEISNNETKFKANYLSLSGYRLPTEAEMEFAIRAGATTGRYFGQTEDLLPRYAWYGQNSAYTTHPVGSLKPNDLGLFDALGNVWVWCEEPHWALSRGGPGERRRRASAANDRQH